jgi:RNA polymerase sigma-70 factor (ECF subfamily)
VVKTDETKAKGTSVTQAEEFEELRPLLFAIAYRILGSVDAVQETWLGYQTYPTRPASAKAFLSTVVTRISINVLRSARVRREEYVGPWLPEPLLVDPYEDPKRSAELADSVSMAALLLLERLSRLERAVFVLREVFAFGFDEIASAVGRSEAACRQLAVRARRHIEAGRPRFEADRREREQLAERFFEAFREGDIDALRETLAADVQMTSDSGGKAPRLPKPVYGVDNVARVLAAVAEPLWTSTSGCGSWPACWPRSCSAARRRCSYRARRWLLLAVPPRNGCWTSAPAPCEPRNSRNPGLVASPPNKLVGGEAAMGADHVRGIVRMVPRSMMVGRGVVVFARLARWSSLGTLPNWRTRWPRSIRRHRSTTSNRSPSVSRRFG